MDLSSFGSPHAVSPLDGRYRCRLGKDLEDFSEFGQTRLRVLVEISYLAALGTTRGFILPPALEEVLRDFSEEDFQDIKAVEAKINHDVKAVEMWVASKAPGLEAWVHFGLTSQDINGKALEKLSDSLSNGFKTKMAIGISGGFKAGILAAVLMVGIISAYFMLFTPVGDALLSMDVPGLIAGRKTGLI